MSAQYQLVFGLVRPHFDDFSLEGGGRSGVEGKGGRPKAVQPHPGRA